MKNCVLTKGINLCLRGLKQLGALKCAPLLLFVTCSALAHSSSDFCASKSANREENVSVYKDPRTVNGGPFLITRIEALCEASVDQPEPLNGGGTRLIIRARRCVRLNETLSEALPQWDYTAIPFGKEMLGDDPFFIVDSDYYWGGFECAYRIAKRAEQGATKVRLKYSVVTGDGAMTTQLVSILSE